MGYSLFTSRCKSILWVWMLLFFMLVLGNVQEREGRAGHVVIRSTATAATVISDQYHHAAAADGKVNVDISYMNKRRVPNGADPIHNKGVGKSRRPPNRT